MSMSTSPKAEILECIQIMKTHESEFLVKARFEDLVQRDCLQAEVDDLETEVLESAW